jgi:hypothetical protein
MIVPSQLALKTHTNFGCAASLATLDKLVDRFPLPPVAPPIGDTSLIHVMRLVAHSTMSPTLTVMGQSFIMTLYKRDFSKEKASGIFLGISPIHKRRGFSLRKSSKKRPWWFCKFSSRRRRQWMMIF